uniref:EZ3 n=1 Tax=Arundo donax TaxID=35708 RepID=A0A0A9E765_ARUDO
MIQSAVYYMTINTRFSYSSLYIDHLLVDKHIIFLSKQTEALSLQNICGLLITLLCCENFVLASAMVFKLELLDYLLAEDGLRWV